MLLRLSSRSNRFLTLAFQRGAVKRFADLRFEQPIVL